MNPMTVWLFLSGILAPAIFWIGYFYYKDRLKPEPLIHIGTTYILGFTAAFLCFKLYGLLPHLGIPDDPSALMDQNGFVFLLYCIFVVGLIEEFFKFLPFLLFIQYFKTFDEKVDGIIYAAVIGLGFASFENLQYLLYLDGFEIFGRAIASPLTHTVFASIWGYFGGNALRMKKNRLWTILFSLFLAGLLHGLFDFFTLSSQLRFLAAFLILIIWIGQIIIIDRLQKKKATE